MNHLDEGTIHAWLDSALDTNQSRDVESHVAQCATCRAAVAEARGLIAGASRILTALDDVPAGVTPQRSAPPKRQWRAAPWVTGIAAALILAVGLTTWSNSRGSYTIAPSTARPVLAQQEEGAPTATAAIAAAPAVADSAVRQPGSGSAVGSAPPRARRRETVAQDRATSAAEPMQAKRAAPPVASLEKVEDKAAASVAAPAPLSETRGAQKTLSVPQRSANASDFTRRDSAGRDSRGLSRVLRFDERVVPSIPLTPLSAVSDVERSAGCYRLPGSTVERVSRDVKAVADRGRTAARPAPSAAAAPSAGAVFTDVPPLLRLDPDTVPNRFAHSVRAAASDSTLGTWNPVAGDSVRVDLRMGGFGMFVFAAKDRVSCPQSR